VVEGWICWWLLRTFPVVALFSFPWHPGDGASRLLNSWSEDGKVKNPVDDF